MSAQRHLQRRPSLIVGALGFFLTFALLALAAPGSSLAATGSISGLVTHGGIEPGGVPEAAVCALKSESEERVQEENCRLVSGGGGYAIPNLAPGLYKVLVLPEWVGEVNWVWEYYGDTRSWLHAPWVEVKDGLTTEIDDELLEGGYVIGTVGAESGRELTKGVKICAEEPLTEFVQCTTATGGFGGYYMLFGLIEGNYRIHYFPEPGQGVSAGYYGGSVEPSGATLVNVKTAAVTEPVDVTLPPEATITGRVTDLSTHLGLEEIEVCAFELSGPEITECEYSDPSGSYAITGLPAGPYKVGFFSESEEEESGPGQSPYPVQFWEDRASWDTAKILSLGLGITSGIDAELGTPPTSPVLSSPAGLAAAPQTSSTESAVATTPPARRRCRAGKKWKVSKGLAQCVTIRHRHHRRHRPLDSATKKSR